MGFLSRVNRNFKKAEKEKQDELNLDAKNFMYEVKELMNKYKVAIRPVLQMTEAGITPILKVGRLEEKKEENSLR